MGHHVKLEELARVKVLAGESSTVESYHYLVWTIHWDDEDDLAYRVTSAALRRRGWIVGYRSRI